MNNHLTESANRAISAAVRAATSLKQEFVGTEHILIGLLKEKKGAFNILYAVCMSHEDYNKVINILKEIEDGN